jgi:flagellar hook-associated protein FlgK
MLENLLNLIKEHAGDAVINNPAISNEHNDAVIAEAGHSITGGLQNMISQGNLEGLMNLFHIGRGIGTNNSTVQNISGDFAQNLMNKFGLNQAAATSVAGALIPSVLQSLVSKTNDPNDKDFDFQGILSQLSGGRGLEGLLGGLSGPGVAGGLMDKVKGLFA